MNGLGKGQKPSYIGVSVFGAFVSDPSNGSPKPCGRKAESASRINAGMPIRPNADTFPYLPTVRGERLRSIKSERMFSVSRLIASAPGWGAFASSSSAPASFASIGLVSSDGV